MKKVRSSRSGFTLLELLVVVAIIGFLSSVSIVALSATKSKSRDTQRKLDQVTILKAVELYTNDFGAVPTQLCKDADANGQCDQISLLLPSNQSTETIVNRLFAIPTVYAQACGSTPICIWPATLCNPGCNQCSYCTIGQCNLVGDCGPGGGPGGIGIGDDELPPGDPGPGPVGPTCGNAVCEGGETFANCPSDCTCGNGVCKASQGETSVTCPADCGCNSNLRCETWRTENLGNCSDCSLTPTGPTTCGNAICEVGETPFTCSLDCNALMCTTASGVDACCLSGTNCSTAGQTGEGYYGVCNVDRCEQKYLLQKPSFTCSTDDQCAPVTSENKFVASLDSNWLLGLEPYLVKVPSDPGGHPDPVYNVYYASSHPDIVKGHRFCVWVSYERESDNFIPYNDITTSPTGNTGPELLKWTPLCVQ